MALLFFYCVFAIRGYILCPSSNYCACDKPLTCPALFDIRELKRKFNLDCTAFKSIRLHTVKSSIVNRVILTHDRVFMAIETQWMWKNYSKTTHVQHVTRANFPSPFLKSLFFKEYHELVTDVQLQLPQVEFIKFS